VAMPMMYLSAKAAFASIDRDYEDMARVLGGSGWQVFVSVSIPMASRGLLAGVLLTFARALGEFGATAMVFGWQPGHTTLPISIYTDYEAGEMEHSTPAVVVLSLIALGLIALFHHLAITRPKR